MNTLKDYVNWKLTHADKTAEAEGYPLTMQNCKANKKMKQLEIYGNLVQDDTPTPETPVEVQSVGELVTDTSDANYGKYRIPVVVRGINLFSMAKAGLTPQTINGITFTPLDDERIHIKGKAIDTSIVTACVLNFQTKIPIKQGIYSIKPFAEIGAVILRVNSSSGNFITNINSASNNNVFTKDGFLSYMSIRILENNTKEWDDIVPIQLTQGTDLKYAPYEPYVEPVTTNVFLNEPLRKIGDYADCIDGKNNKVVRKVKAQPILSTASINKNNWYHSVGWDAFGYSTKNYPSISESNRPREFCTHFQKPKAYSSQDTISGGMVINSDQQIVYFITGDASDKTVADFKVFLKAEEDKGTPVTLYYRLAEPTEDPISLDLTKLKTKTTVIEVDTSLAPSNMYGKYIKK